MPKAYRVVTYRSVSNPQKLAAYAELAVAATAPFGAPFSPREPRACLRRRAEGAYGNYRVSEPGKGDRSNGSPAYQDALKALGDGAVRDVRIIEGLE